MLRSLRKALAESHVAAVAILLLLFFALDGAVQAALAPLPEMVAYIATAIAIRGAPSTMFVDPYTLLTSALYLSFAVISMLGAWLVSRWIYRAAPLRILVRYYFIFAGRNHA